MRQYRGPYLLIDYRSMEHGPFPVCPYLGQHGGLIGWYVSLDVARNLARINTDLPSRSVHGTLCIFGKQGIESMYGY